MKDLKIYVKMLLVVVFLVAISLNAQKAPDFTIETFDGKTIRSSALLEKGPIFLDFWATWCQPCVRSLPHINSFVSKYPNLNVVVVSVDRPRDKDKALNFIRSRKYDFIHAFDGSKDLQNMFNASVPPRSIIINQDGEIIMNSTGYKPGDEEKYIEILDKLFSVGK